MDNRIEEQQENVNKLLIDLGSAWDYSKEDLRICLLAVAELLFRLIEERENDSPD